MDTWKRTSVFERVCERVRERRETRQARDEIREREASERAKEREKRDERRETRDGEGLQPLSSMSHAWGFVRKTKLYRVIKKVRE